MRRRASLNCYDMEQNSFGQAFDIQNILKSLEIFFSFKIVSLHESKKKEIF